MIGTIYILYGYVDRIRGVFFQFAYLYNDIIRQRRVYRTLKFFRRNFGSR